MSSDSLFLDERRLLRGPWQAFERDVARLLLANGFDDVRIVGGSGDRGADVLGVKNSELWVFQCKYTSTTPAPSAAIAEVVAAGRAYQAHRLVVATSRPGTDAFHEERARFERQGLRIEHVDPAALMALMQASPEYPPARRNLRAYQEQAAANFRNALVDTGRAQA